MMMDKRDAIARAIFYACRNTWSALYERNRKTWADIPDNNSWEGKDSYRLLADAALNAIEMYPQSAEPTMAEVMAAYMPAAHALDS